MPRYRAKFTYTLEFDCENRDSADLKATATLFGCTHFFINEHIKDDRFKDRVIERKVELEEVK